MSHPRYCLTSILVFPPILQKLLILFCYPRQDTANFTHAGTASRKHVTLVRHPRSHGSKSPTLAPHPRQHATSRNTPPMLAFLPHKHANHDTTLAQTVHHFSNSWVSNLASQAFSSQIRKRNSAVFTFSFYFYNFYFLGSFKHFNRSLENCQLFQMKLVCLIQKTTIFSKTNGQFIQENCLLILVSLWPFYVF